MNTEQLQKVINYKIQKINEEEAKKDWLDKIIDVVLTWWHWIDGQRTEMGGYKIMTLFEIKPWIWFGLIRYKEGNYQPIHRDPLRKGFKGHFKINVEIKSAEESEFITMLPHFNWGRVHIFWAHHNPHQVTPVAKGTRYVLSFSLFVKKFKEPDGKEYWRKAHAYQQEMLTKHEHLKETKTWQKVSGEVNERVSNQS